jgi:hypothetical protein
MTRQTSTGLPRTSDRRAQPRRGVGRERRKAVSSWMTCALLCGMAAAFALPGTSQSMDSETVTPMNAATALSVVRWNGTLPEAAGRSVELRFALYEARQVSAGE